MPKRNQGLSNASKLCERSLSRWDGEGGAGPCGSQKGSASSEAQTAAPALTNAELVQLRVRVIALENILIALLAQASDRELDLARQMAGYISPRPGFTPHPLTLQAAVQMIHLVERSAHFRVIAP